MAKQKIDGVIEGVRYAPDGSVAWVRAYERRGPTYSDVVLLPRQELVSRLQAGKKFFVGKRKVYLSSEFILAQPVRLLTQDGTTVLATENDSARQDHLDGAPLI